MLDFMTIAKALADRNRVRVLLALRERDLCVCQIIELLRLAPSTVSKHMWILRQARLVQGRKEGRWAYYSLADERAPAAAREAVAWVGRSLSDCPEILEDAVRLSAILQLTPEELCRTGGN
jgi:DNA-binding transcriptional ArsR family regulator